MRDAAALPVVTWMTALANQTAGASSVRFFNGRRAATPRWAGKFTVLACDGRPFDYGYVRADRNLSARLVLEPSIPADVLAFIRRYIHRLETLEVLALLQGSPSRGWTAKQVSDEMRSSPVAADAALATLVGHGLVARDKDVYSFGPRSANLEQQSLRAVACYREKRTAVIAAIFSAPSQAIRSFADAFTLKKGKSDG